MILPDLAFCLFYSKHDLIQPLNNEMVGDFILKDPKLLGPMKISNLSTPTPTPTTFAYIGNETNTRGIAASVIVLQSFASCPGNKIRITRRKRRHRAYRLHMMAPLSLFLPPVQGSKSIWQSGISLQSCSCCSIGVQQLPHMFLLSRGLKAQEGATGGLRTLFNEMFQ